MSYKLHSSHIITKDKTENIKRSKTVTLWSPVHFTSSNYKIINTKKLNLGNTFWFLLSTEDQRGKNPGMGHDHTGIQGCCFSSWSVVARWSLLWFPVHSSKWQLFLSFLISADRSQIMAHFALLRTSEQAKATEKQQGKAASTEEFPQSSLGKESSSVSFFLCCYSTFYVIQEWLILLWWSILSFYFLIKC